jgi:hypothetical protein
MILPESYKVYYNEYHFFYFVASVAGVEMRMITNEEKRKEERKRHINTYGDIQHIANL